LIPLSGIKNTALVFKKQIFVFIVIPTKVGIQLIAQYKLILLNLKIFLNVIDIHWDSKRLMDSRLHGNDIDTSGNDIDANGNDFIN